ncbi:MAG TPA: adenylate/guanylate cyclase domain-containing protein, partial [Gaiellaceae bacterium]|nr:adenylate/guanylate cyclase domain-containing protein [Gaiellaceae bacterium]
MASELPTGIVTLLFTDVEGSTRLLQELGDGYGDALHEHRRRLRAAFAAHGGVEVDTQGDAFFVAFGRASDAVSAAADAQRGLADGPIRVRMGLHTGEPRLTAEGYVGLDVHKGARIAAVGHGGQVLLSQATRALVEAPVRDLGSHRLKDLSAPERIFQLEVEGLPCDFPLLKTLEVGMRSLPHPGTSFVGRATELEAIDGLLEEPDCRLLTLVGPGGVGKTRLALEAAARRIERYPHGVHFVPLVSVASPQLLAPAVAESIQFAVDAAHSGFSAQEQLLDYLSERSTLLVLDNFEHLVDGSGLLGEVIERAPGVELLTTSRERLNVQSEWVFDVEGLGLAENGNGGSGALRLFVERAAQARPGFELDGEERAQALRICRLVAGMPLGIELAASWVSMLSCAEIAGEIERNVDFLATSMRDVPERHRSLRAAFDHSWRLLSDEQRDTFAQLSVFRGGFDREAAVAVAGADLRLLTELVSKSLVRRPDFGRFELHELLRQYAAEKLDDMSSDASTATRGRHARHYAARLAERRDALVGAGLVQARDELRGDLDNLRAATEWGMANWDGGEARGLLAGLHQFFVAHSWFDGAETFERLAGVTTTGAPVDPAGASPVALAAIAYQTELKSLLGYDEEMDRLALACLPRLREHELGWELASCLLALGTNAMNRDVYPDAVGYLEEALEMARSTGNGQIEAIVPLQLGFVQFLLGDLDSARTSFEASRDRSAALGNPQLLPYGLSKLGILADAEERYGDALELHMEANRRFAAVGDSGGIGYALSRASLSAYGSGDFERALQLGRAGHEAFKEVNHRWGTIAALCRIGFASLALGDPTEAAVSFRLALERAHASEAISLELLALSGIGAVLAESDRRELAAVMLLFALGHEYLPSAYGFAARPALQALEAELAPDELAAARAEAAEASLADL